MAMTGNVPSVSWAERAADRSPMVKRWRSRNIQQMRVIVEAAKRLIVEKGSGFTTQELAREAGMALQTFYRHFGGKDQLLLAVIEDNVTEATAQFEERTQHLKNPIERLHLYVKEALSSLDTERRAPGGPRFIVGEHWRLHQRYPEEMAHADQAVTDFIARQLRAAQEAGLLAPTDPDSTAEMMTKLLVCVYHHYAFAAQTETAEQIAERTWKFCLAGIGGGTEPPTTQPGRHGEALPV